MTSDNESTRPTGQPAAAQAAQEHGEATTPTGVIAPIHLIRIPERTERVRAMEALVTSGETWVRVPGNVFCLTSRQLQAVQAKDIAFEWVSKAPSHA
ncbi:MAG: hypothetical protein L0Z62_29635 [Gemmataceae bacterium]|nr:hypothetical protein [Gemmataceae bacterium]